MNTEPKRPGPIGIRVRKSQHETLQRLCKSADLGPSAYLSMVVRMYLQLMADPNHMALVLGMDLALQRIAEDMKETKGD